MNKIRLIVIILSVMILYAATMIDGRSIYDPQEYVDCKLGEYIHVVMRKDCIGEIIK